MTEPTFAFAAKLGELERKKEEALRNGWHALAYGYAADIRTLKAKFARDEARSIAAVPQYHRDDQGD